MYCSTLHYTICQAIGAKHRKVKLLSQELETNWKCFYMFSLWQMAHNIRDHHENMGIGGKRRWPISPKLLKFGTNWLFSKTSVKLLKIRSKQMVHYKPMQLFSHQEQFFSLGDWQDLKKCPKLVNKLFIFKWKINFFSCRRKSLS